MRASLVVVFVCAAALCGCRPAPVRTYPSAPVILISIDTLRADRLPLYGYRAGSTPTLDQLGREGIVFDDVYSHCPLTLPAHASLLTGRLPPRHGVRDNIGFTLAGSERTLATRFKAAGWATGAAISAYVLRRQTGIAQGFDFYDDALEVADTTEAVNAIQRDGRVAVDTLSRWIEGRQGERVFAFLHLYEPHSPYTPPPAHRGLASAYDGEVAYADELVGRFLDRLKASGLYDRAIVAVVSDHGEGLGDHGEAEHGIFLYRENLHIPLIVRLPGGLRGGTRVSGTAGQVDFAATLLDLTGLPADSIDGQSLRPALDAGAVMDRRAYSETLYPRFHFGWSNLFAVSEGRLRYIRAPRSELYDLATDPKEIKNLIHSRASSAASMDRWLDGQGREEAAVTRERVPAGAAQKLQALGYLSGSASTIPSGALPDPKDKIAAYEELKRAMALHQQGREAEAVDQFRSVLRGNPNMLDAWESLGLALARLGKTNEGVGALKRALALDPMRADTHLALAKIYALDGKSDLARTHAEIASETNPAEGYEILAQLMMDAGRLEQAVTYARKSVAADSQRFMSHFILGTAARQAGRCEEAVSSLRAAEESMRLQRKTVVRNLHAALADCLVRLGREQEAEREFLAEISAIPTSREGRVGAAMLYRSQGRDKDARNVLAGLVSATPQPSADDYWTVVRTFSVLGDQAAARDWTRRARTRFPSDHRFR